MITEAGAANEAAPNARRVREIVVGGPPEVRIEVIAGTTGPLGISTSPS